MTATAISEQEWSALSQWIAQYMGLHFSGGRQAELRRGIADVSLDLGFPDTASCVRGLPGQLPDRERLQLLASRLTIGETYFFRDRQLMDALALKILPELIAARRGRWQRLRIWSAGCASGEEAYSLAILLDRALPDFAQWQVTITATDINPLALHKAAAGVYGEWSFRDVPPGIRERYFHRAPDGRHTIAPRIRKLVNFEYLNLVQDRYPCIETDTNGMDIVFCRNVLMYFHPRQIRQVVGKLHRSLAGGGWLVVSPAETSHALFPEFDPVIFPGAIAYRRREHHGPACGLDPGTVAPEAASTAPTAAVTAPPPPQPALSPAAVAQMLSERGQYADAVDTLLESLERQPLDRQSYSLLARALANQGQLEPALAWCERWIAADRSDPAGHYLRAMVLLEQGDARHARDSLRRATYLEPDFVLAHFGLGNLARREGRTLEAARHFANTRQLLGGYGTDELLPESDGLSAGRLLQTLVAFAGTASTNE